MATNDPMLSLSHPAEHVRPEVARRDFQEIYRQNFDFIWRTARSLGVSSGSIDDVVQETFLVAHRRLDSFEGRASIRTWLTSIALRVVSQHRRTTRRKAPWEPMEAEPPSNDSSLDDRVAQTQAGEMLVRILDSMDEDQRTVFVLAEIEGMTMPEIAEVIDAKEATLYSRLRLARKAFEAQVLKIRARDNGGRHV